MRGKPDHAAAGRLDIAVGILDVESELVSSIIWASVTQEGGAAIPREDAEVLYPILGTLDDGVDIALLGASRMPGLGMPPWRQHPQQFSSPRCFLGSHVTEDTTYESAEIAIDEPWPAWLRVADIEVDVEIAGAGTTKIVVRGGNLVARARPMTAEEWSRRVMDPFCALLMMVSGHGVRISETILGRPDLPDVRQVPHHGEAPDAKRLDCLITPSEVTGKMLIAWFALVHRTVPVAMVLGQSISRPFRTVEVDVMVLAACAEAIHREVLNEAVMTKGRSRTLRGVALEGLEGEDWVIVSDRLADLIAMSFRQRLKRLIDQIGDLAGVICGSVGDRRHEWIVRVSKARNAFAHMSRNSPEDLYAYTGEMMALQESLRWLLTAVTLRHIGVPPERVTEAIESASAFHLFRKNSPARLPAVYGTSVD